MLWFLAVGSVGGELAGLAAGIIPVAAALSAAPFGRTSLDGGLVAGTLLVAAGLVGGLRAGSSPEPVPRPLVQLGRRTSPPARPLRRASRAAATALPVDHPILTGHCLSDSISS